jgi:hypothetical protein
MQSTDKQPCKPVQLTYQKFTSLGSEKGFKPLPPRNKAWWYSLHMGAKGRQQARARRSACADGLLCRSAQDRSTAVAVAMTLCVPSELRRCHAGFLCSASGQYMYRRARTFAECIGAQTQVHILPCCPCPDLNFFVFIFKRSA